MRVVLMAWLAASAALGASGCVQGLSAATYQHQMAAARFEAEGNAAAATEEYRQVARIQAKESRRETNVPPLHPGG